MGRVVVICFLLAAAVGARGRELPAAAEVLTRVQERMEKVYAESVTNRFEYRRTNIIEELDGSGKLRDRTVKAYEVIQMQGLPRAKLVAVDGRALSASEQKWRVAEEQRLQKTLAGDKAPDYSKPKPWVNEDMLARFDFKVTGRTNYLRRQMLILEFTPKKDAPSRGMADRIINKVSGAIWVDESESEIARLDLRITESVKFWGGILGQLDRFNFTMLRRPSPQGIWFNESSDGMVQIRKLFTSTKYKISEQAYAFDRARS
ncbi:MAG TPA: hypothetical protein VM680_05920 [Verrucomicrobiae bacterium]|nr:hypothetical protein [Verrucomicrobiae bacterium]